MNHLLKLLDLTPGEIVDLLNLADQLKYEQKHKISHTHLIGKTLGMIFQKASTRTRVSFEVGMSQLGGSALFLSAKDLQIGRGEPIEDTARVLSRYVDGLMIRTYGQKEAEDLAQYGSVPIINGLTDFAHPCQILADLMTIREYKGALAGLKLCYVGAGNNVCNSTIVGALKMDLQVSVACPTGYAPDDEVLRFAKEHYPTQFCLCQTPEEAAASADVVVTDVWVSMGQEQEEAERKKVFTAFQVNTALLELCNKDVIVQHCLPAHREEEISGQVFEAHANEIFDEAENRLHAQKAVLVKLLAYSNST